VMPTAAKRQVTLPVPECAATAIDVAHLARCRGEGNPLDGHRLLCQLKVAAVLGILDGRPEVSEQDWELAELVMAVSDVTRARAVAVLQAREEGRNVARAKSEAVRVVVVEDAKEVHAVARVAASVLRVLEKAGDWMPRKDLRNALASRDRTHLDAALESIIAMGRIEAEDVAGTTQSGARYRVIGRS
jgi:hypothetical protein